MGEDNKGLEDFLSKVDQVGDMVHNLAVANDESVTEAFKTADDYLKSQMAHDEEEEKGFNRTVINTSRDMEREDNPNTNTEAESFCKALEEDAQERATEREQQQRVGKQKKKEANVAFRSEDYTKSLTLYTEAIQHIPDDVQLYTNRALTYMRLERYEDAIKDCDLAIRLDPKTLKGYLHRAKSLNILERFNEATECLEEALKMVPERRRIIRDYMNDIGNPSN